MFKVDVLELITRVPSPGGTRDHCRRRSGHPGITLYIGPARSRVEWSESHHENVVSGNTLDIARFGNNTLGLDHRLLHNAGTRLLRLSREVDFVWVCQEQGRDRRHSDLESQSDISRSHFVDIPCSGAVQKRGCAP